MIRTVMINFFMREDYMNPSYRAKYMSKIRLLSTGFRHNTSTE